MAEFETYEFGGYLLNVPERRLSSNGRLIALEPRAFDLLVALVRHPASLVTKRELLDLVWPQAFVEEGILSVHISHLRKALGDTARHPTHIETVSRAGYRFVATVTKLTGRRERPPRTNRSTLAEVHELVGRGREHLLTASMFQVPEAVAAFRKAIALDPSHPSAYAGLARACCTLAELRVAPLADAYAEAKSAALSALAMDDACGEAQVALGTVLFLGDWNWAGAARSLERALEINPNDTEARLLYGRVLEALGRLQEGLETKLAALERDPTSPLVHLQIAMAYWHQRNYDAVIAWTNKALELDPCHPHAREILAGAYLKKGDSDRHLDETIRHAELHGAPADLIEALRRAHAEGGRAGVLRFVLAHFGSQPGASHVMLAVHYAEAGDPDEAFRHLRQAIDTRDPALVHLAVAPQWDPLRADPRFAECLEQMGLTEASQRRLRTA